MSLNITVTCLHWGYTYTTGGQFWLWDGWKTGLAGKPVFWSIKKRFRWKTDSYLISFWYSCKPSGHRVCSQSLAIRKVKSFPKPKYHKISALSINLTTTLSPFRSPFNCGTVWDDCRVYKALLTHGLDLSVSSLFHHTFNRLHEPPQHFVHPSFL